jgi:RecA-family ATPase
MNDPNGDAEQSLIGPVPAATLTKWGLHTPQSLRERTHRLNGSSYLVDRLFPFRSVGFLLGDSGLGKSPLWYQLAICVASGTAFLGRAVSKGRAVIVDFENGLVDVQELVERISRYLGLPEPPSDLLIWSVNDCPANFGQHNHTVLEMLREVRPALAIID